MATPGNKHTDNNLIALLNHLGIDQNGDSDEILMELMSFAIQTLGAIRVFAQHQKSNRAAHRASEIIHTVQQAEVGATDQALRETFAVAVAVMTNRIVCGKEIHDLDPSRHLIESFPDRQRIGSRQWLALQWAIVGETSETFAVDFIEQNSNRYYGSNVVSRTSGSKRGIERFTKLAEAHPELRSEVDKEGRSMLHLASRLDSTDLCKTVIEYSRQPHGLGLDYANFNGALPVHNAARFCRSVEVFNLTAALSPSAVLLGNLEGMLPLHWASAKNKSVEIIKSLLQLNPAAIHTRNNEGYLPLHCAGQNSSSDVVRCVYEARPDSIKICDDEGGYPLHHACCFNQSVDVVRFFYDAFPEAMAYPQFDDITPIHLAAAQNDSPEVLSFILTVMPSAAFATDKEGWLALHCLVSTDPTRMTANRVQCLKILLKANPRAVTSHEIIRASLLNNNNNNHNGRVCGTPQRGMDGYETPSVGTSSPLPSTTTSVVEHPEVPSPYTMAVAKGHGHLILRMLLNAQPVEDLITCGNLNWEARKFAIFACVYCLRTDLRVPSVCMTEDTVASSARSKENTLRLLCYRFMGEKLISIPAGVLRKIIKYL